MEINHSIAHGGFTGGKMWVEDEGGSEVREVRLGKQVSKWKVAPAQGKDNFIRSSSMPRSGALRRHQVEHHRLSDVPF